MKNFKRHGVALNWWIMVIAAIIANIGIGFQLYVLAITGMAVMILAGNRAVQKVKL